MFCGIDNILQNIPHIQSKCGNIMWTIFGPTEYCFDMNNIMFLFVGNMLCSKYYR